MRDLYKNPVFYYILVPVVVAAWPLLVRTVYLPRAQHGYKQQQDEYKKAQQMMLEILRLDPDRASDSNQAGTEFSYGAEIDRVANLCRIPTTKYKLSSGMVITAENQKTQSATVTLEEVDVVSFAKFLAALQIRWGQLQCNRVKLTQVKGLKDLWRVDIDFKYYF